MATRVALRARVPVDWSFSMSKPRQETLAGTGSGGLRVDRFRKQFLIEKLKTLVHGRPLVAVAYAGNLNNASKALLQGEMQQVGASSCIMKASLGRRAFLECSAEPLASVIKGPTAVVAGDNDVGLAQKLLVISRKVPEFIVLGALLDCRLVLEYTDVERLARLPPAEVVHRNLIAQMMPGTVLQVPNPAQYLVAVLQSHADGVKDDVQAR
mmetsp:Transcript_19548/g.32621  ORF Transcript_19548/g.32621 Transcript_19548/m.32621 type:complete len:211 (-) Transcript_19548:218-850(-)|eukprot:CAMPEP_0119318510 /NCGR_PEP_ID=MMETSP1333-20130426/46672_1 /TAXON_ID=418940 /ORGANISM="Scyphosphaera apsteinii, Strain RCC1455" /LENGTH=210 /DNA_ID=CAMNT_0007324705 /DNA_START=33 /DNA_END=665 /DNA_ORIENTATION=-